MSILITNKASSGSGSGTAPTVQVLNNVYYTLTSTIPISVVAGDTYFQLNEATYGTYTILTTTSSSTTFDVSLNTGFATAFVGTSFTLQSGTGPSSITVSGIAPISQTYMTPTSPAPLYLKVTLVAGGGGGAGSAPAASAVCDGSPGDSTLFGSSFLTATGGLGGDNTTTGSGGVGGTAAITGTAFGVALSGGSGASYGALGSTPGGTGAASPLGGADGGQAQNQPTARNAISNTGSGGGGGGGGNSIPGGAGGGAGGYISVIIPSPSSSYSYQLGFGGAGGRGNTGGFQAGSGGSGIIIVEEFYQ